MKRTTIHISAALALLLGIAACTQDEAGFLPEGAEGTPVVFTATGLNPAATAAAGTRAPVDGNWEGVQSVAVRMDGTVKAYNVTPTTSDNTSATLTSDDPHYWTNHTDRLVTAWWPYTAGETTPPAVKVAADQSARKDFEGSDLIVAEEQTVSYGNPTLRFTHRTARVTVVLTDYTEGLASVRLTGLSTENGNPAVIAPYYDKGGDTYIALVAPQTVAAGTAFITCKFTNGKVFVYKMQNDAEWKAGEEYTYTVSLAAAEDPGYTVSEDGRTYNVYTDEGLRNVAKLVNEEGKTDIDITLDTDLTLTGEWTPIGTESQPYTGTFNGKDKTITGLTVTTNGQYAGLFGCLGKAGTVKNVVMEGLQITSNHRSGYTGGVVGDSWGTIENCSVSGSVSGTTFAGGVVGSQWGGSITGCSSSATVKSEAYVGGIAGETNYGATLTASYATGDVTVENDGTSNAWAGGIVGMNGGSSTLTACYAAGNVSGKGSGTIHVGGAVGENYGTLTACYWSGLPDNDNGGSTKVDGTTVTWQTAVAAMNAALSGKGWQYELKDGNSLPALKKEQ